MGELYIGILEVPNWNKNILGELGHSLCRRGSYDIFLWRFDGRWRDGPSPITVDRNMLIVKIQNAMADCRQQATGNGLRLPNFKVRS